MASRHEPDDKAFEAESEMHVEWQRRQSNTDDEEGNQHNGHHRQQRAGRAGDLVSDRPCNRVSAFHGADIGPEQSRDNSPKSG